MAVNIKWDITYKCNLNCAHCLNGDFLGDIDQELNLAEIKDIVHSIKDEIDINYISLLGGEPTTRKDFMDICSFFEDEKIYFTFNTNSLLLDEEKCIKLSNFKYLKGIVFSIEGPNEYLNDKIRGKKVFNIINNRIKMFNKYKNINKSNVEITCNTVLTRENKKYMNEMIDFCIDNNVDCFGILLLIDRGNARGKQLGLSNDDIIEVSKNIAEKYRYVKDRLTIMPKYVRPLMKDYIGLVYGLDFPESEHFCGAGITFMYIDNKGNCYPCDEFKTESKLSNIKDSEFKQCWCSEKFSEPFKIMESSDYKTLKLCSDCKYFLNTCFPCPKSNFSDAYLECDYYLKNMIISLINDIKVKGPHFRVSEFENGFCTLINTTNLETIQLNEMSNKLFFDIVGKNLDFSYYEDKGVNKFQILDFIEFLKNKGFISYEKQ